jgi:ribosomal-protein-alanine N-acetyltransferase
MQQVEFRPMLATDIEAIMEIETRLYEFPWTRGIFADCIRANYDCWAAILEQKIIAYVVLSFGASESHILNLAVDDSCQNMGIGKEMLTHIINRARLLKAETILLEVRSSNTCAIHLYESTGFNEIGCRKAYYPAPKGKEDALLFAYQL